MKSKRLDLDGTLDLFADPTPQSLTAAPVPPSDPLPVLQSEPQPESQAEPAPAPVSNPESIPESIPESDAEVPTDDLAHDFLPARMLNEFVYCPRLFYYEHVEGLFLKSTDTVKGSTIHQRVDGGKGVLAQPDSLLSQNSTPPLPNTADLEVIHSRSVSLGSTRLGVVAKMDLIEATLTDDGTVSSVCPVDYKVGSPRTGPDGIELWDADRIQLGLQCLILRDNCYACDSGVIYYRATKQRVPLIINPLEESWILDQINAARLCVKGPIPPPLIDSPKCPRCSLAPICLPDETQLLSHGTPPHLQPDFNPTDSTQTAATADRSPRRLIAPRDEKRALYLNTQGYRVGCNDAVIKVKEKDRLVDEVRLLDVCHVALFGQIQISTQTIQRLCNEEIPLTYFSLGGWFYGITRGHSLKNVLTRIAQFRQAADPVACLRLAQQFVRGKIHNHRVFFMRNHIQPPETTKLRLAQAREDALQTTSLEELLGVEGAAAATYFRQFPGLIRHPNDDDDFLEGIAPPPTSSPANVVFTFDFTGRNRRPPTDPVNALLSLAYSLLAKDCTLAAAAVGLDPYIGFYHQPRHGRPALALDIMEEFRPLIAESTVITAINNRFISTDDFVSAGRAVNLNPSGRKKFFQCYEQRINSLITHPVFDYKVSYRRAIELQFRILARVLTGEIPEYIPFLTR